jgi:hypothetical protein
MPITRNETYRDGAVVAAEVVDTDARTLTVVDGGGVKSQRPLTDAEVEAYLKWGQPPPKSPDEKLAEARTVLEQIASLPAPVLTADVVDLLDDLRSVL